MKLWKIILVIGLFGILTAVSFVPLANKTGRFQLFQGKWQLIHTDDGRVSDETSVLRIDTWTGETWELNNSSNIIKGIFVEEWFRIEEPGERQMREKAREKK